MEEYLELAERYGLTGPEALKYATDQKERAEERADRAAARAKEREEKERQREKEREEKEKEREEQQKQREHEMEIERMRLSADSQSQNRNSEVRATVQRPKLPTFEDGKDNMDNYINRFERIAEINRWPREEWAANLSALLTGRALDTYSRLSRQESDDYDQLKTALLSRYGLTGEGYRKKLREARPEPQETAAQFINRLTSYAHHWVDLTKTERNFKSLRDLMIQEQFLKCCPKTLEIYIKEKDVEDLNEMAAYVATYTEAHGRSFHSLCRPPLAPLGRSQGERRTSPSGTATALRVARHDQSSLCPFCEYPHCAEDCRRAKNWSVTERRERLRRTNACFWCLQRGHRAADCVAGRPRCTGCGGRHHSLLCSGTTNAAANMATVPPETSHINMENPAANPGEDTENSATVTAARATKRDKVLMQTAKVEAVGETSSRTVRIMLDSGSNQTFVRTAVARDLGCHVLGSEPLRVETFGGGQTAPCLTRKVQLTLKVSDRREVALAAYEVPDICAAPPTATVNELSKYPHLTGLQLAEPSGRSSLGEEVDVLIGLDHLQDVLDGRMKMGSSGPIAMGSIFGWILAGRMQSTGGGITPVVSNFVHATHRDNLEDLWTLEGIGISSDGVSGGTKKLEEDEEAVRHFLKTCQRLPDGRYECRWPWKEGGAEHLPTNEQHARVRLKACEAALRKNGRLQEYDDAIQEYIERGHAEKAPDEPDGPVHVLPHHAVYKKDKIRVVFDAAAGHPESLNDFIRTGPNLIADLTGVLMRFRLNRIGLTADLEKAFLQLSLHPADRDVTRFLWRSHALDPEPTTYRMTRVVFGVNASPFLLQATIRQHLKLFEASDPELVNKLSRDIYCDDLITSVETEEEALQVKDQTMQIFSEAMMNMTKWTSSLQSSADPQQLAKCFSPEKKVLGLSWSPTTDELIIKTDQVASLGSSMPETKRTILSIAARFYDPLGFLSPLLVRAKMMLKVLWKIGKGWDQTITSDVQEKWRRWLRELYDLGSLSVPRTYGPNVCRSYQLHVFCDASKEAYAAVAYIRTSQGEQTSTALLISKSRLSPSQEMSIPRLELTAALIGARLLSYVKEQLSVPPQHSFLWTDSMVTLCWVQSDSERWGVYVRNRIREIQALTTTGSWQHCPGHENPADLPSRGVSADRLRSDLWLHGPKWLAQDKSNWPQGQGVESEPPECRLEEKKRTLAVVSRSGGNDCLLLDPTKYSTLGRLLRVTAWVLRWVRNCKKSKRDGPLTTEELGEALTYWIRSSQAVFRDEITALEEGRDLSPRSRLWRLRPKLEDGVLKKSGRLQESLMTEEEKHPIILPPDHHLTQLLAEDMHRQLCHAGTQQVLSSLRDKFWILRGRQAVRSALRRCRNCAIFSAQPLSQVPAPLPRTRVRPTRPFQHTGVDLGGPLFVRGTSRQQTDKLYFVVFTCAVTRALHLEVVSSQKTADFIKAYRRFSARRGRPQSILSDNAKTFKGAASILASEGVSWHYIVERAPWWGGFWERMVGLTKFALRRTLSRALLGREELETVLCSIEGAINERPLTAVSDDPNDQRPLRPADFLHCPVGDEVEDGDGGLKNRMRYKRTVASHLWKRWQTEYLRNLRDFQHASRSGDANIGDLVLIEGEIGNRLTWKTGVIKQLHPGRDGLSRAATLQTAEGERRRPVQRLYLLEGARN